MISLEQTRCVARAICMHAFVTCVIEPQEKIKYSSFQWTLVFYLSLTHAKVSVSLDSECQVMIWITIHWQHIVLLYIGNSLGVNFEIIECERRKSMRNHNCLTHTLKASHQQVHIAKKDTQKYTHTFLCALQLSVECEFS